MRILRYSAVTLILAAFSLGPIACGQDAARNAVAPTGPSAQGSLADPNATSITLPFDSDNFKNGAQNPYFPLVPGTILTYRQETSEGVETNTVEVTRDTKMILGVRTTVVHDQVFLNGALKEDTFDWYAPDKDGNVWYFGEDTKELGPPVSTAGSWEAGKDGAQAGLIMLAHPQIGDTYYQESAPGVVADQARVKSLNETITVPYGTFTNCIKTQEWTPLEPGNRAFKLYASGFGIVYESPNHGEGPLELTGVTTP